MSNIYSSYTSPLDQLVFDSIVESKPTDMETEADLALWTNAQFTFDNKPGSGILDDKYSPSITAASPTTTTTSISSPSSITYENLANYLDYELPQQQQQQQLQQQQQQQIAQLLHQQQLITAATATRAHNQPLLLPKLAPEMTIEEIAKALLSTTNTYNIPTSNVPSSTSKSGIQSLDTLLQQRAPAEEDKRRRNTAASARFRIKKKMREQSMEKTVREMTEKSAGLQDRVRELELEIKWLRGLLIEKGTAAPDDTKLTDTEQKIKNEL